MILDRKAVTVAILIVTTIFALIVPKAASQSQMLTPPDEEPSEPTLPVEVATSTKEAKPEFEYRSYEPEVREYFADIPLMIEIARCESGFYQYEPDGTALKNKQGSSARGVFQVMLYWHDEAALAMGFDVRTLDGNLGYARWLFLAQGSSPWEASADCWRKEA